MRTHQHGRVSALFCTCEDEALQSVGWGGVGDEEVTGRGQLAGDTEKDPPYLGPVEFDVLGRHRLHTPTEIVRDTDGLGIRLEIVHGDGDGEVRGEEKAEAEGYWMSFVEQGEVDVQESVRHGEGLWWLSVR